MNSRQHNSIKTKNKRLGCKHPPLFQIAIDHVIPDNLHLYLRITDVLFNLLITDIQRYDGITKLSIPDSTEKYLNQFEFHINTTCKIPFHFKTNRESKETTWRDLMGPEKHIVFKNISLPDLFPNLPNVHCIQTIWDDFQKLCQVLQKNDVCNIDIIDICLNN